MSDPKPKTDNPEVREDTRPRLAQLVDFLTAGAGSGKGAEGAVPEGGEPAKEAQAATTGTVDEKPAQGKEPEGEAKPKEPEPAKEPEKPKLILGKFKSHEDLEKSYAESEKKLHEQGQEIARLRTDLSRYQGEIQSLQEAQQAAQREAGEPELTDEQLEAERQDWDELFAEDPKKAVQELVKRSVASLPGVQYAEEQRSYQESVARWQQQIKDFKNTHEDYDQYLSQINVLLNTIGEDVVKLDKPVEVLYNLAKAGFRQGKAPETEPPPKAEEPETKKPDKPDEAPDVEALLKDENLRKQILGNESIRQDILREYASSVKQGKPPVVIGNQPSGLPAVIAPEELKTSKDTLKAVKGYFSRLTAGGG